MVFSSVIDTDFSSVTVSVVSHKQADLVTELLTDLARCESVAEIIVTRNVPEPEIACPPSMLARVRFIENSNPLGFSENHNRAFGLCKTRFFCVINPDIRFDGDPFLHLIRAIASTNVAVAAPAVHSPDGDLEDSVRHFPRLYGLLLKAFGLSSGQVKFPADCELVYPDWVAGMFMLFTHSAYFALSGFDEGFFLYYEDVDICVRAWRKGLKVGFFPSVVVTHDARRDSHRNLRHMRWHLLSMLRYFIKHLGRLPDAGGRGG